MIGLPFSNITYLWWVFVSALDIIPVSHPHSHMINYSSISSARNSPSTPTTTDGNYWVITLFSPWQWKFNIMLRDLENFLLPQFFSYNIYDNQKYYPGETVNIHIRSLINIIQDKNWVITTKKVKGKLPLFSGNGEQIIPFYANNGHGHYFKIINIQRDQHQFQYHHWRSGISYGRSFLLLPPIVAISYFNGTISFLFQKEY